MNGEREDGNGRKVSSGKGRGLERRKTEGVEPQGDGAKKASGPGPVPGSKREGSDEKSVIIIITAERTTIINHH